MKFIFTKTFFRVLAGLLALVIVACAAVAIKYYRLSKEPPEVSEPNIEFSPDLRKGIKLGDAIDLVWTFKSPWSAFPVGVELSPGAGSQLNGKPVIRREKILWGKSLWKVSAKIQPYTVGKIEKGKATIHFNRQLADGSRYIQNEVPEFDSEAIEVENPDELAVADKIQRIPKSRRLQLAIAAVAAIILLALAIWKLLSRSAKPKILVPPWQIAIIELCELRKELNEKSLPLEKCVNRLTDIVRSYLEKRFRIKAPAQTTSEFLDGMKKGGPLDARNKEFLSDFLQAADLVKFAKLPAESHQIEDAMKKAEELVKSTIPTEDENHRSSSLAHLSRGRQEKKEDKANA